MSVDQLIVSSAGRADPGSDAAEVSAILERLASGEPIAPEVLATIHARAEQVTAEIRRTHGLIGDDLFQSLLDDEA